MTERWVTLHEFPDYEVSSEGRIYNIRRQKMMKPSSNGFGNLKISLRDPYGERQTRSVALMVAECFIRPPNFMCDHVINLDGNLENVRADNLAWRPRGFAWKYAHQMRELQPLHYRNLPVRNITKCVDYDCIVDAGIHEGLIFDDIWRSTYTGMKTYPYNSIFEIIERV